MATYTFAVTLPSVASEPLLPKQGRLLVGSVNINPYSQTRTGAVMTAIKNAFENASPTVLAGVSDGGFIAVWDNTNGNFKCFGCTATPGAGVAYTEAAEGSNVGNFTFAGIGF